MNTDGPQPDLFDLCLFVMALVVVVIVFILFLNVMAQDFATAVLHSLCPCRVHR